MFISKEAPEHAARIQELCDQCDELGYDYEFVYKSMYRLWTLRVTEKSHMPTGEVLFVHGSLEAIAIRLNDFVAAQTPKGPTIVSDINHQRFSPCPHVTLVKLIADRQLYPTTTLINPAAHHYHLQYVAQDQSKSVYLSSTERLSQDRVVDTLNDLGEEGILEDQLGTAHWLTNVDVADKALVPGETVDEGRLYALLNDERDVTELVWSKRSFKAV